jgi:hypothetical protein
MFSFCVLLLPLACSTTVLLVGWRLPRVLHCTACCNAAAAGLIARRLASSSDWYR